MGFLRAITRGFIDVFGITHPTPEQERKASLFICGMLGLIVLGLGVGVAVIYRLGQR